MKKVEYILFSFLVMFIFLTDANAATTAHAYINSTCNIRTGPGTQNTKLANGLIGSYYLLVEDRTYQDTNNHYDCNSDWYQIYYNGGTAYVCGDHVDVVRSHSTDDVAPSTTCEIEMSNLGFPSSYWGGLCALKERHPNWQFVAVQTNLDWSYAVQRESSCGKSYLQTSNEEYMDRSCTNQYGWDSSWKNASQTAVAYYMDPRNFLSDRYIFQFEYLKYSDSIRAYYPESIRAILDGAAFYTYHMNLGNNLSTIMDEVGLSLDVSPTFLAARILQELGSSTSLYNLYSGIYPGYEGYYNFYNYGVSDECATTNGATVCGLIYAKDHNWYGLNAALSGGASFIASSYVNAGQYTTYLQKFNLVPTNMSSQFTHQYQTNIAAPSSESSTTYKSYSESGILDQGYVFYIPVFNNMDATITNSNNGATGEEPDTSLSTLPISTIVTSSGYKYQSGYMTGVSVGSDINTIKGAIESVSGYNTVVIMDSSGNEIQTGSVKTGMHLRITNASGSETLKIAIKGDTSGDGIINALDLLQVQKYILGTYSLTDVYALAGDTSGDGIINALDLLQVQKDILGTYEIVQ